MDQTTECLAPDDAGIARAAALLAAGGLVAFPTETVYGLGADARQGEAVARIFAAKGRPSFNPLIVHVPTLEMARHYGAFDADALALAQAFWPGPLTLVVPLRRGSGLSELVTAGLDTVGLRIPRGAVAERLLAAVDGPVAAPSANPSGRVSPTCAEHVRDGLDGRIAAIVDGGPAPVGIESTIVGCFDPPRLLRPGGLPTEILEEALGAPLEHPPEAANSTPNAPGQLASHYAPNAALRLNVAMPDADELYLGFGSEFPPGRLNLSPSGDLTEAAANLFAHLRKLDSLGGARIAVAPIPDHGLGRGINDRLERAAAPRPDESR